MDFFAPINKMEPQDDGSLVVIGRATDETLDSQGEVVKFEAAEKAFSEWSAKNIREMHDPHKAVGKALDIMIDRKARTIDIKARISAGAKDTQAKILDGTLGGFSIGGEVHEGGRSVAEKNGAKVVELNAFSLSEVSVVDAPANPSATFALAKAVGEEIEWAEIEPAPAPVAKAEDMDEDEDAVKSSEDMEEKADEAEEEEDMAKRLREMEEKLAALESVLAEKEAAKAEAAEKAAEVPAEKTENDDMPTEAAPSEAEKVTGEEAEMIRGILAGHFEAALADIMDALGSEAAPVPDAEMAEEIMEASKSDTPTGDAIAKAAASSEIAKTVDRVADLLETIEKRVAVIEGQPNMAAVPVKHETSPAHKSLMGLGVDASGVSAPLAESLLKSIPEGETVSREALAQRLAFLQIANAQRGI